MPTAVTIGEHADKSKCAGIECPECWPEEHDVRVRQQRIQERLSPREERYLALADTVADTVIRKQRAYGDSFGKSGAIVRVLYPYGIPPEKLEDGLAVIRVIDKLFRIATDRDALGESPWADINGYCLLAMERIERERDRRADVERDVGGEEE